MAENIMKNLSDDEKIRRVWDRESVKNLAYRHAHYFSGNLREKELDELWVKEPEHAATASYGRNWGYYVGMDEIRKYYVDGNPVGDGGMLFQPVSTDMVFIANDGQTAQGMWYSMGNMTLGSDGSADAEWLFERVCMDAVREGDEWKIWHLFIGTDVAVEPSKLFDEQPVFPEAQYSLVEREFVRPGILEPTLPMAAYTSEFNWYEYPPLPTAYETFSEVTSCGPEGNPAYKKEG